MSSGFIFCVYLQDDMSSRPSDAETSDDDGDSEVNLSAAGQSAFSESIPNSPQSSHWYGLLNY